MRFTKTLSFAFETTLNAAEEHFPKEKKIIISNLLKNETNYRQRFTRIIYFSTIKETRFLHRDR